VQNFEFDEAIFICRNSIRKKGWW